MKKLSLISVIAFAGFSASAQAPSNTFPNKGWGGIGVTAPVIDFQINGSDIFTQTIDPGLRVIGPNGPIEGGTGNGNNWSPGGGFELGTLGGKKYVTYGPTAGILLTNATTGKTVNDGGILRMSDMHLYLDNYEADGNISIANSTTNMLFHANTKRIFVGGAPSTLPSMARFNLNVSNENGMYIQAAAGYYGLALKMENDNGDALRVLNTAGAKSFKVSGSGEVFARRFTTTMLNIPDYVFAPDYKLMPLAELKIYIEQNKHLPNIPSAAEYAENGVDIGEMNRLLLEKTEEQTLYILQLEERMKVLEAQMQLLLQPKGNK